MFEANYSKIYVRIVQVSSLLETFLVLVLKAWKGYLYLVHKNLLCTLAIFQICEQGQDICLYFAKNSKEVM